MRSLKYSIMLTNLIDDVGHEIILRQRDSQEPAHYCVVCDVSFLNLFLFFVQKKIYFSSPIYDRLKYLTFYSSKKLIENMLSIVFIVHKK